MDHSHCGSCVSLTCDGWNGCPVETCRKGCGAAMHRCKMEEHVEHTCPYGLVPCSNTVYGCEEVLERIKIGQHLQHCAASVLECGFHHRSYYYYWHHIVEYDDENLPFDEVITHKLSGRHGCQMVVRRDEFAGHWQTYHLDVTDLPIFQRCPMFTASGDQRYYCKYREMRLLPYPNSTTIDYNQEYDCLVLRPPQIINEEATPLLTGEYAAKIQKQQELALYGYETEESLDVLGQLPVEILMKICGKLDSLSLWSLSQVNHYIRKVCLNVVKKKGVVYSKWMYNKDTQTWVLGPKIWSFSKVCSPVSQWSYSDVPSVGAHMMSCDQLRSSMQNSDPMEVWDVGCNVTHKRVLLHQADFGRYK